MRNLILYSAISLDGFIATKNGAVEWLHDPDWNIEDEDFGYGVFYDSIDTTIMGGNTFRQIEGFDVPFPYPDKTNYVISRNINLRHKYIEVINGDIKDFIIDLKAKKGKDIWLVGGSQVNSICLRYGLIDKMILSYIPVVLGTGIQLFTESHDEIKFNLIETKPYINGMVQLTLVNKK